MHISFKFILLEIINRFILNLFFIHNQMEYADVVDADSGCKIAVFDFDATLIDNFSEAYLSEIQVKVVDEQEETNNNGMIIEFKFWVGLTTKLYN